jgi:hypothetical protein
MSVEKKPDKEQVHCQLRLDMPLRLAHHPHPDSAGRILAAQQHSTPPVVAHRRAASHQVNWHMS